MSNSVFDRNIAPIGYIDLRPAITSLRRRMFVSEIPEKILEAAETNVKLVGSKIPIFVSDQPQNARDLQPMDLLADSLHSGALTMFIYAESQLSIIPVPAICTCPVLEKAGFLSLTRKNVAFRFRNFYPRQILDGLNIPRLEEGQFEEFGLCLRERKFDEWLRRHCASNALAAGRKTSPRSWSPEARSTFEAYSEGAHRRRSVATRDATQTARSFNSSKV
jgi:hypothetical protein